MSSDLRRSVLAGLRWLALARLAGQLAAWASTIIVIRLLAQQDYGLMAMAMLVIGLLALINELGLGAALVQSERVERATIGQVLGLQLLINAALCGLLYATAPWFAAFFNEPRLTSLVRVLSLQFPLGALGVVPRALLGRAMRFQRQSLAELLRLLVGGATTLSLALTGWGVWALVWGNLAATLAEVVSLQLLARSWVWPRFQLAGARRLLGFGGTVTVGHLLSYLYNQSDQLLVGKLLGKEVLGVYAVALNLAALPLHKLSGLLNEVAFAAYSRLNRERSAVGQYVLKTGRLLSCFAFPVFFGIAASAPELVMVLLGTKWQAVILPLQLLSPLMPLKMAGSSLIPALYGIGRPDIGVRNLLVACLVLPPAVYLGSHWGLTGVCLAWLLLYPLQFLYLLNLAAPVLGITVSAYLQTLVAAGLAASGMVGVVYWTRYWLEPLMLPPVIVLAGIVTAGVISYPVFVLGLRRDMVTELLVLFRRSGSIE